MYSLPKIIDPPNWKKTTFLTTFKENTQMLSCILNIVKMLKNTEIFEARYT